MSDLESVKERLRKDCGDFSREEMDDLFRDALALVSSLEETGAHIEALQIRLALTESGQPLRRELIKVLETWSKPCRGPCEHAHCPLLHKLGELLREHSVEGPR